MLNNFKAERGERIRLRRILGNQTVRFRGGWHWPRTVPMAAFLISSSERVGPATSSDLCVMSGMAIWKIRKTSSSVLKLRYQLNWLNRNFPYALLYVIS